MGRLKLHETSGVLVAAATSPAQFLYALSASHVNNNLPILSNSLGISLSTASWIINVELIVVVITATMTGKLCDRFGTSLVMSLGTAVFAVFNLLFLFGAAETSLLVVLILRFLASAGLGLMLPASTPLAVQLVKKGKLNVAIAIMSIMVPFGFILSSLIAGYVAQYGSWRYMFAIVGGLSLLYLGGQLLVLPYKESARRRVQIDFLGVIILSVGLTLFIVGLTSFAQQLLPWWGSALLLVASVGVLAFFAFYNIRLSRAKVFPLAVFNRSTVVIEVMIFMINVLGYSERFLMPYIFMVLLKLPPGRAGILISITGCSTFAFAPLASFLFVRVTTRRLQFMLHALYLVFVLLNILNLQLVQSAVFYTVITFVTIGLTTASTIISTNYNFSAVPPAFQNTVGVLNQLVTNAGHSVGVTLAVLVNNLSTDPGQELTFNSATITVAASGVVAVAVVATSLLLSLFQFERGRWGYSERQSARTKTFDENLLGDHEVLEVEQFGQEKDQEPAFTYRGLLL
ncbi:Major facilitator superfamily protein [Spironucleus salmonicida]|uniref:Major facilitator superfamily protein n=1 Tax=Spironucleus salmonicida TaxID=348837 RepID=A0A9P8M1I0_9EUKA|nr:Major facilitator superfamily protein [Spironucleus salmonicida]